MARSNSIPVSLVLLLFAAVSGLGQTQPGTAASKIVIVNTSAFFDEKIGITKIVTAAKQVNAELAPKRNEVEQFIARVENLSREIKLLQDNVGKGIPIDEKAAQVKTDQFEKWNREGKYRQDEFNSLAQKRQAEFVGPVFSDVLRALSEYIKSKGYGMVFDASKDQNGFLIFATEQYDITKDFITFYNSRPPTAITSVPK